MKRPAMTLIELLAALVILSAVAASAASTLQEASASARSSALRNGAAQALAACPDLARALTGGVREDEFWPREVSTSDGKRWRVSFATPEPLPQDIQTDAAILDEAESVGLDVAWATVVVQVRGEPGASDWIEAWRFETPIPNPEQTIPSGQASSTPRRRGRSDRRRCRSESQRSAMTLIETLASLAILSMLAGVVGVWTTTTLRLQSRIAASGPDELSVALAALREDLDSALPGDLGPVIKVLDDGAVVEVVAPPRGPGLGMSDTPPSWRTVRWQADSVRAALVRTEVGDSESTWIAAERVISIHAELVDTTSDATIGGPNPPGLSGDAASAISLLVRINWEDPSRNSSEFRWESAP